MRHELIDGEINWINFLPNCSKKKMEQPSIKDYEFISKLGNGSYSTVYKGQHKASREIYAIKCIDKATLSKTACDNLITEIRLLKKLRHKHIVEMKEFVWDEKTIYIVMEYCNGSDLLEYIKRHRALSENTCKIFLRQLAAALKYMRDNNVSHFDLKPQNLLLHRSGPTIILKIADFGFAQHMMLGQETTSIKGSPLYMAPEILLKQCYTASADLWSIGIILYECLFGKAPYSSKSMNELLDKIAANQRIQIPPHTKVSSETEDLLTRLLERNPDKRISFDEFFNHEFLDLKHYPTDENMEVAIEIVKHAVDEDTRQNYKQAYHLYCEALQYFVPIILAENDATKKMALRKRTQTYLHRAEEIKRCILTENCRQLNNGGGCIGSTSSPHNYKSLVRAALTPSLVFQQLYTLSTSTPALKNALEVGRQAELYAYEGKLNVTLESFKSALGILIPLLAQEPKSIRRDLLHQQVMEWMKEAESIKSLLSAHVLEDDNDMNENLESKQCVLQ